VIPSKDQIYESWALKKDEKQAKGVCNISNKIIAENFPNLKREMPIQVQEASRTLSRHDQNKTSPQHIIVKTTNTENKERKLKALREKDEITYKGKSIKMTADFSKKTLKARKAWCEVFQALR
jgi:hypothetical protein